LAFSRNRNFAKGTLNKAYTYLLTCQYTRKMV
jgi:hypothetical protein